MKTPSRSKQDWQLPTEEHEAVFEAEVLPPDLRSCQELHGAFAVIEDL